MTQALPEEISVRNVFCDYYLEKLNSFNRAALTHAKAPIPILRVFGILESGEKCCVHVHGVFPYFYLRIERPLTDAMRESLIQSLNAVFSANQKRSNDLHQAIFNVVEVSAKSMYGYHRENGRFVKVIFYNPQTAHYLIESLYRESVRNPRLQPFQAHIPYVLQFFIDNAIFGMDVLRLRNYKFRIANEKMQHSDNSYFGQWRISDILSGDHVSPMNPESTVAVEIDVFVKDITNKLHLANNKKSSNPGLEFIWKDEERRSAKRGEKVPTELSQEDMKPHFVSEHEMKDLETLRRVLELGTPAGTPASQDESHLNDSFKDLSQALNETFDDIFNCANLTILDESLTEASFERRKEELEEEEDDEEDHNLPVNPPSEQLEENEEDSIMPFPDNLAALGPTDFRDLELEMEPRPVSNISCFDMFQVSLKSDGEQSEAEEAKPKDDLLDWYNYFELEPEVEMPEMKQKVFRGWVTPSFNLPCKERSKSKVVKDVPSQPKSIKNSDASVVTEAYSESWCMDKTFSNVNTKLLRTNSTTKSPLKGPLPKTDGEVSDIRNLCTLSIDLLVPCRSTMPIAEPEFDAVYGVFYAIHWDVCVQDEKPDVRGGWTVLSDYLLSFSDRSVERVEDEVELFVKLIGLVQKYDPDILIGYDSERGSWGYLFERDVIVGTNLVRRISRCPKSPLRSSPVDGRIVLNLWKICRSDLNLRTYTLSNIVLNVLDRRIPDFNAVTITGFVESVEPHVISTLIKYLLTTASVQTQVLCQMDLFTKTAEMARVYGIQFYEVLSRGSQFRVESMLLRLAASLGFLGASVSPAQRSNMDAAEIIPLNLEPQSAVYRDPVLVLDFQSLYPSIAIAYNYCFSTCLGKIGRIARSHEENIRQIDLGACKYTFPWEYAEKLASSEDLHVTPVGGVFVKRASRRGLLPTMLEEILNTRIMVKKMMKKYKDNKRLQRILDARQLALKLVANVTYGYTAANWSGRMPCVDIADAIVSKGRETLERAIQMVKSNAAKYRGARVVYGDTDSLFVHLPGMSTERAFEIGKQIAEDVTADNPYPVKLKFEKVMQPVVLITKKRYVGMSTEEFGGEAVFDAKGIETVRRDGCPFVSKVMEKFLRVLFESNVDTAIHFLRMKLQDIEKYPFSDFIFAKEFRGGYAENAAVPAKKIADRRMLVSERFQPVHGERVPYVVVEGESPTSTVISCVVEPSEYFANQSMRLNYDYYVLRQLLPALHRVLELVPVRLTYSNHEKQDCYGCRAFGQKPWCVRCRTEPLAVSLAIVESAKDQNLLTILKRGCRECATFRCGLDAFEFQCGNLFCPINDKIAFLQKSKAIEAAMTHGLREGAEEWIEEEPVVLM